MQKKTPLVIISAVIIGLAAIFVLISGASYQKITVDPREMSPSPSALSTPAASPVVLSSPSTTPLVVQSADIQLKLPKERYKLGEQISFTITNTTQKMFYYYEAGCSNDLVETYVQLPDRGPQRLKVGDVFCEAMPTVAELTPGKTLSASLEDDVLAELDRGYTYTLRFRYAPSKTEDGRIPVTNDAQAESAVFSIE